MRRRIIGSEGGSDDDGGDVPRVAFGRPKKKSRVAVT